MVKLTTDLLKRSLPERGKRLELRDDDEPGLIFRVTDSGHRSWSLRYRNDLGEQRRKSLGPYPAISLARAREEARRLKGAIAHQIDVVGVEQKERADSHARNARTLSDLADAYFEAAAVGLHRPNVRRAKRASTLAEEQRVYDKHLRDRFGRRPLSELTRSTIQDYVTHVSRRHPSTGRHVRNVLRQMLRLAVNRELIDYNPAQDISVMPVKDRDRCLSEPELKAFWKACELPHELDGLALSIEMGLALRMAAVTLQRGGEVVGMRWSELDIDNRVWSIPPDRMKSARPHAVPLSEQAITLLEQSKGLHAKATDYVFLSPRSTNHIERRAFSRAMNRIVKVLGMPRATPHDLRRTGATMLTSERIGISRFIVSQVLGHSSDTGGAAAVTGIYDRYAYLPEKRRALNAWAAHLMQIVGENEETSTVINMRLS